MTTAALRPTPRRVGRHFRRRHHARRKIVVSDELLSVAGIVGTPVREPSGHLVGLVHDVVVDFGDDALYPPVAGVVVRSVHGRTFVPAASIAEFLLDLVRLTGALEHQAPERNSGLVALAHDVIDRQIVDTDGGDVRRVSDLVLARRPDGLSLVGVDVSIRTMLRRLGTRRLRRRVSPTRVYDWASIAAFSAQGEDDGASVLHLTRAASELRERGPADLEALLEDLPARERDQFAAKATSL